MQTQTKEIYASGTTMDTSEIKDLCSRVGLECRIIDLSELSNFDELYAVIHTGQTKNEYNSGITNHWVAIYGKYFFDSYGKYSAYALPEWVDTVDTVPRTLQEYSTNVCGMYVISFLKFCHDKSSLKSDPGREYSLYYDFDTDKKENDRKILDWSKSV